MAHSLELRSPLLDHRVVELGLSLPDSLKLQGRAGKVALRRAFAAELPPDRRRARQDGLRRAARTLVPRASCARSRATCCSTGTRARAAGSGRRRSSGCSPSTTPAARTTGTGSGRSLMLELWQRTHVDAPRQRRAVAHDVTPARAYAAVAAVCALPRLVVLLHERDAITSAFTEKSDIFAQMFVKHGTFGFIPGEPSAYTQPLYGWFLIPVYWIFGRSWLSIGLAQIVLAVATALLVYEIGRRVLGAARRARRRRRRDAEPVPRLARRARQPRDRRPGVRGRARPADARSSPSGRRCGSLRCSASSAASRCSATRGSSFMPILCRRLPRVALPRARATAVVVAVVLAGAAVAVAPWLVRNKVERRLLGDHDRRPRAVEGEQHRRRTSCSRTGSGSTTCKHIPRQPTPELLHARGGARRTTRRAADARAQPLSERVRADVVLRALGRFSSGSDHPGEKAKLDGALGAAALAAVRLRDDGPPRRRNEPRRRTPRRRARVHDGALRARARRASSSRRAAFVALALLLLAYQTGAALAFVGATRYRVAWDFLSCSSPPRRSRARRRGCRRARRPRMRVVHVHRIRGIGGSERHLLTLLPALAERGHRAGRSSGSTTPTGTPARLLRRVARAGDPDPGAARRRSAAARAARPRALRADVVHTHLVHADVYGGAAARLRGATLVSTKHNDDPFRAGRVPLRRARARARAPIA